MANQFTKVTLYIEENNESMINSNLLAKEISLAVSEILIDNLPKQTSMIDLMIKNIIEKL